MWEELRPDAARVSKVTIAKRVTAHGIVRYAIRLKGDALAAAGGPGTKVAVFVGRDDLAGKLRIAKSDRGYFLLRRDKRIAGDIWVPEIPGMPIDRLTICAWEAAEGGIVLTVPTCQRPVSSPARVDPQPDEPAAPVGEPAAPPPATPKTKPAAENPIWPFAKKAPKPAKKKAPSYEDDPRAVTTDAGRRGPAW